MLNTQRIIGYFSVYLLFNVHQISSLKSFSFSPIVIVAEYRKEYQLIINSSVEYVLLYPNRNTMLMETARIVAESNATHDLPLIVVARQKRGILSWQIPLFVHSVHFSDQMYNKTGRTLCSNKYYSSELSKNEDGEFVTISLSTSSYNNILCKINMVEQFDFNLRIGDKRTVEISPSEPIYFGYNFPNEEEHTSVVVHVESDDDVCMTISIQNATCPVFDLERNIQFSGYWQTVSQQGGITISKEAYPLGFFMVFVVKADDTDCSGSPSMISVRNKHVTLTILPSASQKDYIFASGIALSAMFGFCMIYVISNLVLKITERKRNLQLLHQESEQTNESIASPSTIEEIGPQQFVSIDEDSSLDEDDIDLLEDSLADKEIIRTKLVLSVCDLARKDPKILRHKSRLYLYYLLTVTVFYALPAVQLVFTYQHVLHVTGNQDMCYYNFLCAHPLGLIYDYNHVFSNFGYVALGLLFISLTYFREQNSFAKEQNECYGIPTHYGLFYAMGTALVMEGILSGCYHICPNRSNFQFDSSFMYIITVLSMVKIYQTRHPDVNARAPVSFGVLALLILLGLMGVLYNSTYFWILFTITHLSTCLLLTIEIYYMGRLKYKGLLTRMIHNCKQGIRHIHVLRPVYPGRFILIVLTNLCNVCLAVLGNIHHTEFASFLLTVLLSNLILYIIFYIVMKVCYRERILVQPFIYIVLAAVCWGAALYFFLHKTISWNLTPAQSRLYNKPCRFLNFFDNHDIWHFLSAFAMFFSFMVLLTLDDDLIDVHRSQIPVF